MSKPNYRVLLSFDGERKVFVARAPELEHCTAEGATRAEAVARVEEEIGAQLQNMLAAGSNPPGAVDEETFSGELTAKVSKILHRDLAWQARSEGVDLDQLVGELLAAALEGRKGTRSQRGGNRQPAEHVPHDGIGNSIGNDRGGGRARGGYGPRYNGLLDDRANFIEYVRGLEGGQGGNNGPSRGAPGPRTDGPGGDRGGRGGRRRRGRGERDQRNDRHAGGHPGGHGNGHHAQGGPSNGAPSNGAPSNGNPGNANNSVGGNPGTSGGGNPGNGNSGGNSGNGNP